MSLSGQIAIAGVHEHPTRWAPDKTDWQIMGESARGALEDAGLQLSDVDGLFAAGMGMGAMGVISLAEYLNLKPEYIDGTNIGGSSFVAHVNHAAAAIPRGPHGGRADPVREHRRIPCRGDRYGWRRRSRRRRVLRLPVWLDDRRQLRARRSASHARVRHHERAAGRDRSDHAPSRLAQPEREDAQADHARRRAREPRDLRSPTPARLLHHQRRGRGNRRHLGGAGPRPAEACRHSARLR